MARSVYLDDDFDANARTLELLEGIGERGVEAKERAEESVALLELTGREAEQRVRRAQRGAERDELLATLEELEWWFRDLVVLAAGAEAAVVHVDRRDDLHADATRDRLQGAERACELIRVAWREAEELARLVELVVIPRPGQPSTPLPPPFRGRELTGFPLGVSSSQIRSRIKRGLSIQGLVPDAVAEAMRNSKLYL